MESGTQSGFDGGRKNQVFGGFAGCGGRWVAQTAPKHVLEPPRSRCTALGGGRRSHAAPAAAARFCRFSRYGRSSRVPSHKIRCRGFPLTKQKCGISLSRPPRPCDQKGSHSLLAKRTSWGAKNALITQLRGLTKIQNLDGFRALSPGRFRSRWGARTRLRPEVDLPG